jgi:hypothetical protein
MGCWLAVATVRRQGRLDGIPCLHAPMGLAVSEHCLFIADTGNRAVQVLDLAPGSPDRGELTVLLGPQELKRALGVEAAPVHPMLLRADLANPSEAIAAWEAAGKPARPGFPVDHSLAGASALVSLLGFVIHSVSFRY